MRHACSVSRWDHNRRIRGCPEKGGPPTLMPMVLPVLHVGKSVKRAVPLLFIVGTSGCVQSTPNANSSVWRLSSSRGMSSIDIPSSICPTVRILPSSQRWAVLSGGILHPLPWSSPCVSRTKRTARPGWLWRPSRTLRGWSGDRGSLVPRHPPPTRPGRTIARRTGPSSQRPCRPCSSGAGRMLRGRTSSEFCGSSRWSSLLVAHAGWYGHVSTMAPRQ